MSKRKRDPMGRSSQGPRDNTFTAMVENYPDLNPREGNKVYGGSETPAPEQKPTTKRENK